MTPERQREIEQLVESSGLNSDDPDDWYVTCEGEELTRRCGEFIPELLTALKEAQADVKRLSILSEALRQALRVSPDMGYEVVEAEGFRKGVEAAIAAVQTCIHATRRNGQIALEQNNEERYLKENERWIGLGRAETALKALLPSTTPPHDAQTPEAANDERIDLIHKKYKEGLTEAETQRLAALEEIVSVWLSKVAPLPPVPTIGAGIENPPGSE
jgi:hypothetical protein